MEAAQRQVLGGLFILALGLPHVSLGKRIDADKRIHDHGPDDQPETQSVNGHARFFVTGGDQVIPDDEPEPQASGRALMSLSNMCDLPSGNLEDVWPSKVAKICKLHKNCWKRILGQCGILGMKFSWVLKRERKRETDTSLQGQLEEENGITAEFQITRFLSCGLNGCAFACNSTTHRPTVLKVSSTKRGKRMLVSEAAILKHLRDRRSRFSVHAVGELQESTLKAGRAVMMTHADGEEMADVLGRLSGRGISESFVLQGLLSTRNAIAELFTLGVGNADQGHRNIMLKGSSGDVGATLIDFGEAQFISNIIKIRRPRLRRDTISAAFGNATGWEHYMDKLPANLTLVGNQHSTQKVMLAISKSLLVLRPLQWTMKELSDALRAS